MKPTQILKLLQRSDKWSLGGGGRLLYAPAFPLHVNIPGFWDIAHYFNYELRPLFTWTLLDAEGRPMTLLPDTRTWNPAVLATRFRLGSPHQGLSVVEEKSVLPSDVACATIRLTNRSRTATTVHLVGWTAHEAGPSPAGSRLGTPRIEKRGWQFDKLLVAGGRPAYPAHCRFILNRPVTSRDAVLSEGTLPPPRWELTPFGEGFHRHRLRGREASLTQTDDGVLFVALHTALALKPGEECRVSLLLAVGASADETADSLQDVRLNDSPPEFSRRAWEWEFAGVPSFSCSDECITRYYWYRWYGLRFNTIRAEEGNYAHPFVCEGTGYFRAPISYSAFCHVIENRWRHDPSLARGSILTFLDNQREDGGLRGYLDVHGHRQEMFYHANWGDALRRLDAVHPSDDFLREVYPGFKRYAQYFDRERDDEASGLYDIDNHYETGQEYMHRYTAVDPEADRRHWGEVFRLKGVDVTVYVYELKRTLAEIARRIGRSDEAALWDIEAEWIRSAVLDLMWDPEAEMFFDVNPATGLRTGVKSATCFYPYLAGMTGPEHTRGLRKHLLNPKEFWTPFPAPSSSADDLMFSAEPLWKGKRMNCPWNGRVWPMTNSHLADALALTAIRFQDRRLREKFAQFLAKFVRMMFFDGDPARPNCFEHYHPYSGLPSLYRGVDDYMHSWVNDLIIRYVCGVRPEGGRIVVDPFPFRLRRFSLDGVLIRGRRLSVEGNDRRFTVRYEGSEPAKGRAGKPVILNIEGQNR